MNTKLTNKLKEILEKEKSELQKELESFATKDKNIKHNWSAKYPGEDRGNKEEEADEAGEYENLVSLEENLELKLRDIDLALEKIKNKKYGKCENCGKEIEEKRLMACPEAKLCIECNK